ncbi:hypothetical protein TKK_0013914 [Trichogramma kaykai]
MIKSRKLHPGLTERQRALAAAWREKRRRDDVTSEGEGNATALATDSSTPIMDVIDVARAKCTKETSKPGIRIRKTRTGYKLERCEIASLTTTSIISESKTEKSSKVKRKETISHVLNRTYTIESEATVHTMECEVLLNDSTGEFEPIKVSTAVVPHFEASQEQGVQPNHANKSVVPKLRAYTALPCWNCNVPGHLYKHCPVDRDVFCYKCGRKGYTTRSCPNKCDEKKRINMFLIITDSKK